MLVVICFLLFSKEGHFTYKKEGERDFFSDVLNIVVKVLVLCFLITGFFSRSGRKIK